MSKPADSRPAGFRVIEAVDDSSLQELQRLAELGKLSASLLHEITNPLAAALLHLEQSTHEHTQSIRRAKRSINLLRRYVEAARQQARQESRVGFFMSGREIDQVRRVLGPLARSRGIKLDVYAAHSYRLYGDPVKFQQIVANLVSNALDASQTIWPTDKTVRLIITATRQFLIIRVTDRGSGITSEELPRLFEPFYTTKSTTGHNMGLGLTAVKRYVEEDFSGSIRVRSTRRGTTFTVRLRLP
jgi:signal transduction histidine kinase